MSKAKSIFVTAIMAIMLAVILAGLAVIEKKAYFGMVTTLAVYGFIRASIDLCGWLQKEPADPQHLSDGDIWSHDDEFSNLKEE